MNKGLFGFFALIIALFVGALYYSNAIQSPFITALHSIKSSYHTVVEFLSEGIEKHFAQAKEIEQLKEELARYENNHLVMQQMAYEIEDLYKKNHANLDFDPQVQLVRTLSYAKFNNFNKLWLDVEEYNSSKIYGLTYKELVAGIVVNSNEKPLALLNKDIKSSYAVFVGKDLAPGIAHGNNGEHLLVKFIPAWFHIQEGDEVITSGLDTLFFKGLKVGKVLSVSKSQGYQTAVVSPYYKANNPNYFHMIKKVK